MRDKKFRYFVKSKRRKIRYSQVNAKKKLMVIFFHGFMSDMVGKKPMILQKFCKKFFIFCTFSKKCKNKISLLPRKIFIL